MSWTSQTLRTELFGILKKYVQGTEHELGDRTELVAHLGLDSLAVMEVVADVEDKFGLTIEDDDLRAAQGRGATRRLIRPARGRSVR